MGELTGRVFLVTGANTGIGRTTALALAKRGGHVVITCRTLDKAKPVVDDIKAATGNADVEALALDLSSLADVRRAALEYRARKLPLHVLINNAGVAGQQGLTPDGFELQFGVNHLGHYLFTRLLEPVLRASAPARVVNVSSQSSDRAKGIDWAALQQPTKTVTALDEYAVSKLCNILFAKEGAVRFGPDITTSSLHPGRVATDVWRRIPGFLSWFPKLFMLGVEEGALTTLHCATAPALANETGRYYDQCRERAPNPVVSDALARLLWEKSEEFVGPFLRDPG